MRAANSSGWGEYSETRSFEVFQESSVPGEGAITGARLFQNSPNPFTNYTAIGFVIARRSQVKLQIVDLVGRAVATIVDEVRSEGEYAEMFEGSGLPSGVYLARLSVTAENGAKSVEAVSITITR